MPDNKQQCKGLLWLLILIGLFNVLDFFFTTDLVVNGTHQEGNPLLRGVMGTAYFPLVKLALIPLSLAFLWGVRRIIVPKYLRLVQFTCGIYIALILYTWVTFYA